jgi:hypothetical protein
MKIIMKIRILFFFIAGSMAFSCSSKFKKYESNWIVTKFTVNKKDSMDSVSVYNFRINVKRFEGDPPSLESATWEQRRNPSCKIDFYRKSGKDYIVISDHYFFSGTYEIKCLTENCCIMSMKNSRIYLELDYNGDLPFGISRHCPPPRLHLIDG